MGRTSTGRPFPDGGTQLEAEHRDLVLGLRAAVERFDEHYWAECDSEVRYPREYVDAMAADGWLGLTVPTEYGGGGQGHVVGAVALREIAQSGAGLSGCIPVHMTMFATAPIVEYGTQALKREILPTVVSGTRTLCFMVSEPDAGSDTSRTSTAATARDGGWLISGQKTWITQAIEADTAVVLARTGAATATDRFGGLTLFVADLHEANVERRSIPKLSHNAVRSCEVFLDDVSVDEDRVIGEIGNGFRSMLIGLNSERVLMSAEMVGIGYAALRRAADYARTREVFGRLIGLNQAVSHPLARAEATLAGAWLAVVHAARLLDDGLSAGAEANRAKYLAAEACWSSCDAALQVLGGMGVAKESHVERYFRDARLLRIAPVSQEMALNYLARSVLGLPQSY